MSTTPRAFSTRLHGLCTRMPVRIGTAAMLLAGAIVTTSLGSAQASSATCTAPAPGALTFQQPVYVDQQLSGGEPVSVVANDGSILVAGHYGTTLINTKTVPDPNWVLNYRNQTLVWRSTDDGATWNKISSIVPGAHSTTSSGFSDPDFTKDSAGNLYGAEINLANDSIYSSHDDGATWPDADPIANTGGDRPWLAARGNGVVYYLLTGSLEKSTDGGQTWTALTDPPNAYGKIFVDPTDPKGLYVGTNTGVDVSRDDGQTWKKYDIPGASNRQSVMDTVGVDKEGWVYYGYINKAGSDYQILFASFDPQTNTWSTPTLVASSTDPLMWAWTVGGDAGRAAVAWYDPVPVAGQSGTYNIHVMMAVTTDARGSTYTCADGSTVAVAPQFSTADAVGRPIYQGGIPCNGTGCNVTGDRRLGDYFTMNYDAAGKPFVVTGDTMLPGPAGQSDSVSHPLFAIATDSSPKLLTSPQPTAPSYSLIRDTEAGRSALTPPVSKICSDARIPSSSCEQPDTTIEPDIAVNPNNPCNAVAVYQENRVDGGGDGDNGYATTLDCGKTWSYGNLPGLTTEVGGKFDRASDATVAFGVDPSDPTKMNVYADSLVFDDSTDSLGTPGGLTAGLESGVAVNVSHDGGLTWSQPTLPADDQEAGLNDKNWVVVDNGTGTGHHTGRIYTVWDKTEACIAYSYSDDGGQSWSPDYCAYPAEGIGSIPLVFPNGDFGIVFDTIQPPYPAPPVSSDANDVEQEGLSTSDKLVVTVAPQAGLVQNGAPLDFLPPTTVAAYEGNPVAGQRAGSLPMAAVDPVSGRLYVAWESGRFRSDKVNDIAVRASDDEGKTWSPLVRVNPGPTNDRVDHYNAMLDVGKDGIVRVGYRQVDESHGLKAVDTYIQESDTGGMTFGPPLKVDSVTSDPAWGAYSRGGLFQGDYQELAAAGSWTYVVRCESFSPTLDGDSLVSNRYHQTTWVAVVGPAGSQTP